MLFMRHLSLCTRREYDCALRLCWKYRLPFFVWVVLVYINIHILFCYISYVCMYVSMLWINCFSLPSEPCAVNVFEISKAGRTDVDYCVVGLRLALCFVFALHITPGMAGKEFQHGTMSVKLFPVTGVCCSCWGASMFVPILLSVQYRRKLSESWWSSWW